MTRTFIMTKEFDACWKNLHLGDDELKLLQEDLLSQPDAGDRISGTGGIRKYRIPMEGRGKSGGARVCYLDIPSACKLYLLIAYAKNERENISMKERNALKDLSQQLKRLNTLRGRI